jgi:1-phosphofructokinase family hexose kinase
MSKKSTRCELSIITVGLSPAWDITCRGRGLDWGLHKYIDEQTIRPAGKALNVSKALAWMGQKNITAGLWGRSDYQQMLAEVRSLWPSITVRMTTVAGDTRQNVTVVDTANDRDMHLRNKSELASKGALGRLKTDLQALVGKGSLCVFAGAMPENELLGDIAELIKDCSSLGARIVVDTSGPALERIVETGRVWLIKPNVAELCELLREKVRDHPASLARVGRKLLDKVEIVLVSRGKKGAVAVTTQGTWWGRCRGYGKTRSTVGCGDYLLAGFLKDLIHTCDAASALKTGLKVAAAKAWGWDERKTWPQVQREIKPGLTRIGKGSVKGI